MHSIDTPTAEEICDRITGDNGLIRVPAMKEVQRLLIKERLIEATDEATRDEDVQMLGLVILDLIDLLVQGE